MKQESQVFIKDDDSTNQIEYSCFYSKCKFCRCLCQYCKLDVNHQHNSHIANKDDYVQQQQLLKQSIRNAKFKLFEYGYSIQGQVGAISNDLKYVAIGGRDLQIWDHLNINLVKTIEFNTSFLQIKFTDDSKILSVMNSKRKLYIFNVSQKFKQLQTYQLSANQRFIRYISNEIILTSSANGYIRKINVQQKKQLIKIIENFYYITCLDYNKSLNIIVSGSEDGSISFWNANNGQLLMRKQLAHGRYDVSQVLFMINNQLISQDSSKLVIVWNIDYATKRLHKQLTLDTFHYNIQLVLHQQFLISTSELSIKIHSIDGELLREFDHNLYSRYDQKIIQPDSMESCLILGKCGLKQLVFKMKFD